MIANFAIGFPWISRIVSCHQGWK